MNFKEATNLLWAHKTRLWLLQRCDDPDKYVQNIIKETKALNLKSSDALKYILEDILQNIEHYGQIWETLRNKD